MATPVKRRPGATRPAARRPRAPRGRDEIVDAVLDAAERLFARAGPASVSLRDIAAEAHVTYSLINRHFGTKDDLLQALLLRYAARWQPRVSAHATLSGAVEELFGAGPSQGAYLRLLAWTLLAGGRELGEKATLDQLLPLAQAEAPDPEIALTRTAAALALTYGWRFFHPFIIDALHVPADGVAPLHQRISDVLRDGGWQ